MKCVIRTFTGLEVDPLNLREEDIRIEDIAHALALCNRFAGHTRFPISVAQHSVFVSYLSFQSCLDTEMCTHRLISLQGLLHDASEAYLGDVTKWLKSTDAMASYREAEDRATATIFRKYGCEYIDQPCALAPQVEEADRLMVRFEGERGYGSDFRIDHPDYPPVSDAERHRVGSWRFWSWQRSERTFLARFRQLNLFKDSR